MFEIIDIIPLTDLENANNIGSEFFTITDETSFSILQSIDVNIKTPPVIKKIGGLNEICKDLENIFSLALFNDQSTLGK